jgi:hypothetical protein
MPSPTPPREVKCIACGAKQSEHPIPNYYGFQAEGRTLLQMMQSLMKYYRSCVPNCKGCYR